MDSFSTPRPHTSDRIGAILGGREAEVAPPRSGRRHYVSNVAPPRSHAEPITASYAGLQSRTFNDRLERNKSSEQLRIATPSMRPTHDAAGAVHEVLHCGRRPAPNQAQRESNLYGACCEPRAGAPTAELREAATGTRATSPPPVTAESEAPVGRGGNVSHPELASHVE
jgi:hypothetical protein